MKTIKNQRTQEYKRVSDREAHLQVGSAWSYCPKGEWKKNVRDLEELSRKEALARKQEEQAAKKKEKKEKGEK